MITCLGYVFVHCAVVFCFVLFMFYVGLLTVRLCSMSDIVFYWLVG